MNYDRIALYCYSVIMVAKSCFPFFKWEEKWLRAANKRTKLGKGTANQMVKTSRLSRMVATENRIEAKSS